MHAAAALSALASILSAAAGGEVISLGPETTGPVHHHPRPSNALVLPFAEPAVSQDRDLKFLGFELG